MSRPTFDDGSRHFFCHSCSRTRHRLEFSRNQIQSREHKRCRDCIAAEQQQQQQNEEHGTEAVLLRALNEAIRQHIVTHNDPNSNRTQEQRQRTETHNSELRKAATNPERSKTKTDFMKDHYYTRNETNNFNSEEFVKEEVMSCPICYEEMSLESDCHYRCMILKCSHMICFSCYAKMKKKKPHDEFAHFHNNGDDDEEERYNHDNKEMKCPICRENFNHACELPRNLKVLIQFASTAKNNCSQNDDNQKKKAAAVASIHQDSKNNNNTNGKKKTTMEEQRRRMFDNEEDDDDDDKKSISEEEEEDYHRLENLTTGHINNINFNKRCGGVTLDEFDHSVIFFFRTSPRFRELKKGMYVKLKIEPNERRPGDVVAVNVTPFDDGSEDNKSRSSSSSSSGYYGFDPVDMHYYHPW